MPNLLSIKFDDQISLFVVVSGTSGLYIDIGDRSLAVTVGPGDYPDIKVIGLSKNSLSCLGCLKPGDPSPTGRCPDCQVLSYFVAQVGAPSHE